MQKDVDPLPSQGTLDLRNAGGKLAAKSESGVDCAAVANEPLFLECELFIKSLVYRLEHVSTEDAAGVLDVHLPRELPVLERDEHLGHGSIGRWFVQLGVGEFRSEAMALKDCFIHRESHIEAEESPRTSCNIGKQLPVQIERRLFHGHCHH